MIPFGTNDYLISIPYQLQQRWYERHPSLCDIDKGNTYRASWCMDSHICLVDIRVTLSQQETET